MVVLIHQLKRTIIFIKRIIVILRDGVKEIIKIIKETIKEIREPFIKELIKIAWWILIIFFVVKIIKIFWYL
jgi:hypothetical protein